MACAQEILDQTFELGLNIDALVCASGSAGTQAGLVTGFYGCNMNIPVVGINVSQAKEEQEDIVYGLVRETANHVGINFEIPRDTVTCFGDYVGPGYSLPTPEMAEAVKLVARRGDSTRPGVYGQGHGRFNRSGETGLFQKGEHHPFCTYRGLPSTVCVRGLPPFSLAAERMSRAHSANHF